MKKKRKCKIFLLLLCIIFNLYAQEKAEVTLAPQQALQEGNNRFSDAKAVADPLFNPVTADTSPKPNPYPTQSINETAIDTFFGTNGMKVDATTLQHVKNFYFYLEYVTKLELAAKIVSYAHSHGIDVMSVLESGSWKALVDQSIKSAGSWEQLLTQLKTVTPNRDDWDSMRESIIVPTWKEVINTSFWTSISITNDLIAQSSCWQKYLKYAVIQAFAHDATLLSSILDVEKRIFMYIPNIEVAYYNTDFSYLRNSSEFFRLSMILTDVVRNRMIQDVFDWQKFYDQKTNNLDLMRTYSEAELFKETAFYRLASLAHENFRTVIEKVSGGKINIQEKLGGQTPDPLLTEELTCLAMIKNLQAQLHSFFDNQHIENTRAIFSQKTKKPFPPIFYYELDDFIYLEDLATIINSFKSAITTEAVAVQVFNTTEKDEVEVAGFESWFDNNWRKIERKAERTWKNIKTDIKSTAKLTWKDIQKVGGDLEKLGKDILQTVTDIATVLSQDAQAVGALFSHDPKKAKKLWQESQKLQKRILNDIGKANKDVSQVIDDTEKVAKDTTTIGAQLIGNTIGFIDARIGKDIAGGLEAAADILIDFYAEMTEAPFAVSGGIIKLTADAAAIAVNTVAAVVRDISSKNLSHLGADVLKGMEDVVVDMGTTLFTSLSFVGEHIIEQLQDAIKLVGYIVSAYTDFYVDLTAFALQTLGDIVGLAGAESAKHALEQAKQYVEAHRQTVSTGVTTALLVGAVIATDGAALPLIAMTVGPQLFQVYGTFQQDNEQMKTQKEQQEFLEHFKTFVNNNKTIAEHTMQTYSIELAKKYESQITNQERELGFYQNFLNSFFESTKEQMSFYLGANLAPELSPDEKYYNLRFADVGSLYGYKTGDAKSAGVLNLNASQGFSLYSAARNLYSQEIAVSPALSMQLADDQSFTATIIHKFWFNQKETIPLASDVSEVEIKFHTIYVLYSFYIGLYFGGEEINIQNILNTKKAPVDAGHLAKMLVYTREEKGTPVQLKLYEHEGKGWFQDPISGPSFETGQWYHMKMQLDGTTLRAKVWKDGDQEPSWQNFIVAQTPRKTIGIISSGASIEYQIVTPNIGITPIPQLRKTDWPSEVEREKMEQKKLHSLMYPALNVFDLRPFGKAEILKSQFVYTTKATKLADASQKIIDDYVILGRNAGPAGIKDLGASPLEKVVDDEKEYPLQNAPHVAVVSLLSGNAFDKDGNPIRVCTNVLDTFIQHHGPLSDALTQQLKAAQSAQQQKMVSPFAAGSLSLQATSLSDVQQGIFIYKGPQLKDDAGNLLKDEQNNPIYDYLIMIDETNKTVPYNENIQKILSLITGSLYDQKGATIDSGYATGQSALSNYLPDVEKLIGSTLKDAIIKATDIYKQSRKAPEPAEKPLEVKTGAQSAATGDMSDRNDPHATTAPAISDSRTVNPADQSMERDRSQDAGDEQIDFG